MGKLRELLERNGVVVIECAGSILMDEVNLSKALAVLQECDIVPLGLEGFHLDGERLTPDMDMIVDTSAARSLAEAVGCIHRAVASQGDNTLLYELVVA